MNILIKKPTHFGAYKLSMKAQELVLIRIVKQKIRFAKWANKKIDRILIIDNKQIRLEDYD